MKRFSLFNLPAILAIPLIILAVIGILVVSVLFFIKNKTDEKVMSNKANQKMGQSKNSGDRPIVGLLPGTNGANYGNNYNNYDIEPEKRPVISLAPEIEVKTKEKLYSDGTVASKNLGKSVGDDDDFTNLNASAGTKDTYASEIHNFGNKIAENIRKNITTYLVTENKVLRELFLNPQKSTPESALEVASFYKKTAESLKTVQTPASNPGNSKDSSDSIGSIKTTSTETTDIKKINLASAYESVALEVEKLAEIARERKITAKEAKAYNQKVIDLAKAYYALSGAILKYTKYSQDEPGFMLIKSPVSR